ncbi:MAG: AAA family ATPase [Elusimicrobia bacterium]|nr:AAA family ATPase [Elusimicrobiota bacterium]
MTGRKKERFQITENGIELNGEFRKALDIMENTSKNIFITGRAGVGKSTLLEYFRETSAKNVVVLAPTGVAAVNIRGETIHSFFGFKPNITLNMVKKIKRKKFAELYKKIDAIVIDEISMVRADLLDCVDKFLRLNGKKPDAPFGGIQMIFIGDLYQLAPVITAREKDVFKTYYKSGYFFDSFVFKQMEMEFLELKKIYRQSDEKFIRLLNAVRNRSVTEKQLEMLNERVVEDANFDELDFHIYLTPRNAFAEGINRTRLAKLPSKQWVFEGVINGDFDEKYLPAEKELLLKEGAQVMLLNNDRYGRWINGTIGKVRRIKKASDKFADIYVELPDGKTELVSPFKWEIFHYNYDSQRQSLETETVGEFIQYPLKLAWAITIHKSQGKTFDRAIIDISGGVFAYGQVYVALSRCTSLEGIILTRNIEKKHIFLDWKIVKFLTEFQCKLAEREMPAAEKIKKLDDAIKNKTPLKMLYLKGTDEKSERIITPLETGRMSFMKRTFDGLKAYCHSRKKERVFRIDRILKLEEAN